MMIPFSQDMKEKLYYSIREGVSTVSIKVYQEIPRQDLSLVGLVRKKRRVVMATEGQKSQKLVVKNY